MNIYQLTNGKIVITLSAISKKEARQKARMQIGSVSITEALSILEPAGGQ